jgi:hypothetical protein
MAVPSSGTLSIRGLAREKVYDNYSSTLTPTAPYSMYDLVNGGNTKGSGVSFDATNTDSPNYPNTSTPHKMSEWYGYDHDYTCPGADYGPYTCYYAGVASSSCSSTTSATIYTTNNTPGGYSSSYVYAWSDSCATVQAPDGWYKITSFSYRVSGGRIIDRYLCT